MKTNLLSILVVDDDCQNLEGIRFSLERQGFQVTTALDAQQALAAYREKRHSLAILDLVLLNDGQKIASSHAAGIDLARELRALSPQVGLIFRSAYTHFLSDVLSLAQESRGGLAYLFKGGGRPELLLNAIRVVQDGGIYIDPRIHSGIGQSVEEVVFNTLKADEQAAVKDILTRIESLTEREQEILDQFFRSRRSIAQALTISERTVDRHINNIYSKLGLNHPEEPEFRQDILLAKAFLIHRLQHPPQSRSSDE